MPRIPSFPVNSPRCIELRTGKNLSQKDIAAQIEMSQRTVWRAENNKPISWKAIQKIANALQVEAASLLADPNIAPEPQISLDDSSLPVKSGFSFELPNKIHDMAELEKANVLDSIIHLVRAHGSVEVRIKEL